MNQKILVVDDDADNIKVVCNYLKNENPNYKLLRANNGANALKIIALDIPDLILLDWQMPVMNGLETLKHLKANVIHKDITVIMLTGESADEKLTEAFEAGVLDYIKKPVSKLELIARVKSALALTKAQKRTEELLRHILPNDVAEELKLTGKVTPHPYEKVSVMFTDFKGFSSITKEMQPIEVIERLNQVFLMMEQITTKYQLEKIKTIGDAYMCAGGLPITNDTNPEDTVNAALEIQEAMQIYKNEQIAKGEPYFECRIGIHTGKVVAGVIGKTKFAYDIWGSAVNAASRMESAGEAGQVNISETTYRFIKDKFHCEYRGKSPVKNLGEMEMYFVKGKK